MSTVSIDVSRDMTDFDQVTNSFNDTHAVDHSYFVIDNTRKVSLLAINLKQGHPFNCFLSHCSSSDNNGMEYNGMYEFRSANHGECGTNIHYIIMM